MSSSNCSLLVHTFNRYESLWDGFLSSFSMLGDGKCYFGTDTPDHGRHDFKNFEVLYSGDAEWSDRLRVLVKQIPTDYILYMQEDQWPKNPVPAMDMFDAMIEKYDLYRLQISPVNQFYSLHGSSIPLFFHYKSKYLVSHQPSIWKKSFLLDCLKPNENPWVNEYEGTKRLNKPETAGKIAIYPFDWYKHKCENGKLID